MENNTVDHPAHYNAGKIEVIDYIEDLGLGAGFNLGNAIKYLSRAGRKENNDAIQDIKKASWYIQRQYNAWAYNNKIGMVPPDIRNFNCYEYIIDQHVDNCIGHVIGFIDNAICSKDIKESMRCLDCASTLLNLWINDHQG